MGAAVPDQGVDAQMLQEVGEARAQSRLRREDGKL